MELAAAIEKLPTPDTCATGLAEAVSNLGFRLVELDKRTAALRVAELSMAKLPRECQHTRCRRAAAEVRSNLSRAQRDAGQPTKALATAKKALDVYQDLTGSDNNSYLGDWGVAERRYARCLAGLGRHREAVLHGERAVTLLHAAAGSQPHRWKPDLARAHQNLAQWFTGTGQLDHATTQVEEANRIWKELAHEDPVNQQDQVGQCRLVKARVLTAQVAHEPEGQRLGRANEAEAESIKAVAILSAVSNVASDSRTP